MDGPAAEADCAGLTAILLASASVHPSAAVTSKSHAPPSFPASKATRKNKRMAWTLDPNEEGAAEQEPSAPFFFDSSCLAALLEVAIRDHLNLRFGY